ncbi:pirin family protein [Allopusillimonas soli]|uniref:Pirin family protein n=1 Tax=Allopusillimonas soli TaxID=659016 RepID=A0A853FBZ4_9BURK|nr:pirin family protein [Allopusillimonas soli]NYT37467.1 pirin family protein [Allopusillimonas soli]TEA74553.1 pirin family protein [Allopusillimonas soli]
MLDIVIETRPHDLGGGFKVGRVLPFRKHRMVGPFIFFDRMGPHDLPMPVPRHIDVRPHPHIGLSTVTYLFEGSLTHRDSLGVEQAILPGALNWMTAGAGISHSERFDGMREQGGRFDGIQAWVAVPEQHEEDAASFDHHAADTLPVIEDGGLSARLIAGNAFGACSPAKVHSPLFYLDVRAQAGASIPLPHEYPERGLYIARGEVSIDGQQYTEGQMVVFAPGDAPAVSTQTGAHVMLLGGEPVGPRHIWWNFVSSRKERIEQAKAEWQGGRFKLPPMDSAEHIPLPEQVPPAPNSVP